MLFDRYLGTFLGIEFKDEAIVVSFVNNSLSGMTLLDSSSFPLRNTDADIEPVREYIARHSSNIKGVFACVPDRWGIIRFIEVPATKGGEALDQLMSFEIERHIPFGLDEVIYDYIVADEREKMLSVAFTVIRKTKLAFFNDVMERLALKPDLVTTTAFAVLEAADLCGGNPGGWQQIVGIQGHSFFRTLRGAAMFLYAGRGYMATALFTDGVCKNIRAFNFDPASEVPDVEDIIEHINNIRSLHGVESIENIILTGRKDAIPGGVQAFSEKIGADVLERDELVRFVSASQEIGAEGITPSIGACLAGLGLGDYRINLLPHRREHHIGKKLPLTTQVLIGIVIILLVATASADYFKSRKLLQKIEEEIARNAPEVQRIEKLSAIVKEYERQQKELRSISENEITLDMLAELTRIMPNQAWVTNLSYKGWSPGEKKRENFEIVITGLADSSSALIPILEDSPYFEKVEFVGPIKKTRQKEGFKIRAAVVNPALASMEDSDKVKAAGTGQQKGNGGNGS
jgi:Tfp pilus assembly protein PilN